MGKYKNLIYKENSKITRKILLLWPRPNRLMDTIQNNRMT